MGTRPEWGNRETTRMGPIMPEQATQESTEQSVAPEQGTGPSRPPAASNEQQPDHTETVEYWKARARQHEDNAKSNKAAADELEQLKESMATDQDKAIKQARKEARAETLAEVNQKLAAAEVRAVARDRLDVDALLEGADLSRFVKGDDIDRDAIEAWVGKLAPKTDAGSDGGAPVWPDMAQGGRTAVPTDPGFGTDRVRNVHEQRNRS